MTNLRTRLFLAFAGLAVAAPFTTVSAQQAERTDAIAREAAARFASARANRIESAALAQAPAATTTINLSIEDALQRALERNLDIVVERLNPEAIGFNLAAIKTSFMPTLTSQASLRSLDTYSTSQTAGADILKTKTLTGNAAFSQNLSSGGGSYSVAFLNNRVNSSNLFALRNPSLNSSFNALLVQPMMRGFRIDSTRAQLLITKLNQDMSDLNVKSVIVTTLANVRSAYWDFVYAMQAVDAAKQSLALASKLVEDNRSRVEVGTLAPIDVVQAQSEEALRRQTLVQAESTRRTTELALKRLIVGGTDDPVWNAALNPLDRPTFSKEPIDVLGAVNRALANRTDLIQAKQQIQANSVAIRSLVDQKMPALDLTASYGASGIGGPQFIRSGASLGSTVTQVIPSGYTDALSTLIRQSAPQWSVGVNFSMPLGTTPAEASLARARVQEKQVVAQERQLELQIATEVTNAALLVDSNLTRYQAATVSRELAQKRLDAETSKFEVGMSTNFFVVQAQRDLADAQNVELRALLDYSKSLVDFQRAQEAPVTGRSNGGGLTSIGNSAPFPVIRAGGANGAGITGAF